MTTSKLLEASRRGDPEQLEQAFQNGGNVDERDQNGWTALNWAAGRGDAVVIELLIENGADVTATGADHRTPLMIAKAAGHQDAVAILTAAEKEQGVWIDPGKERSYSKAYALRDLRQFGGWKDDHGDGRGESPSPEGTALPDDAIAYLHRDFTVTESMWPEENVIFNDVTSEWIEFCETELGFSIPEDLAI